MAQLRKEITMTRGVVLAVTMILGSGLFGLPGLALEMGTPHEALAAWVLISLAMIPLIFIFSDLGVRFTTAAGLSRYAEEAVGPWGNNAVVYLMIGSVAFGMPAMSNIAAAYIVRLVGASESAVIPFSLLFIVAMTASNFFGVRATSAVNGLAFSTLAGLLVIVIAHNMGFIDRGLAALGETASGEEPLAFRSVASICALLFWAFLGWENLSYGLEEFQNPRRNIPVAFWGSFFVVTALYLLLALTSTGAALSGHSVGGAAGMADLLPRSFGEKGLIVVMILVLLANGNVWVFSISRMLYAGARDAILPAPLARLDGRGIPRLSLFVLLALFSAVTVMAPLTGLSTGQLVILVSQNFVFLFAFAIVAYWRLTRGAKRWLVSGGATLTSALLLSDLSWWVLFPAGLTAAGYLVWRRGAKG
ncbi:amino acid permease [Aminithiophilus ramosus]|uniref:Amino acid permease n=2 Tax=Synergistales TaxID=649776 RepID=A0A9Q7AN64_9BACT|nr:amino acid permease [Aminithiophilus ramosus]QTX32398.1 amino acid permease [Aminithiophilus ramosus]QVL36275.1 amino acid permease [Synergistota bacterium]